MLLFFLLLLHRRRKLYYYMGKACGGGGGGGGGSSSVWGESFPCAPLISANIVHITSSTASSHFAGIFAEYILGSSSSKKNQGGNLCSVFKHRSYNLMAGGQLRC